MAEESTEHTKPRQKQKTSRINNTLHLWEFLFELLEDERYTALIAWTRKEKGEFKIKRQEDVARKWGRLKQRTSMNYDKLSRALRYYYHKGIIKKVPGQRLVYKFDKLPYSYKPIRYNWPWNPPGEDDDIKPDRQVLDTSPATKAASWPLFLEWNDLEKHVKREKLDIVTSPADKKTFCPMTPTWEVAEADRDVKPVKQVPSPPVHFTENTPKVPSHVLFREKQDDKLARQKKIPPLVSIKQHLHTMPTWKNPKRDQSFQPVAKQGKIPPLIPVKTHSLALPRNRVPISLQCHHRNRDYEFSHFGYPSQHPSQGVCRSQIIFPPCSCSCMRSMACGMYLVPDVPPQVPANVLMRFA